jgi:hypothetical protein
MLAEARGIFEQLESRPYLERVERISLAGSDATLERDEPASAAYGQNA